MIHDDVMHDDLLGVRLEPSGSALKELALASAWGPSLPGPWLEKLGAQLKLAYDSFRDYCRAENIQHSMGRFSHRALGVRNMTDWPTLRAKAHNSAM
eukprot:10967668-Alexandrium_andersonii.AAC.1